MNKKIHDIIRILYNISSKKYYYNSEKSLIAPYYYYSDFLDVEGNFIKYKKRLLNIDKRYSFMFLNGNEEKILNPEKIDKSQYKNILLLLKEDSINIYALEAYLIYNLNKGHLGLLDSFNIFFKLRPNDPFMLSRYSRYLGSSLFKAGNDIFYIKKSIDILNKSINIIEKNHKEYNLEKPFYLYGWLGLIYIELKDFNKAFSLIKISNIAFFKKKGEYRWEYLYWIALTYNKKGYYIVSNNILKYIININKFNLGPKDFRVFRLLTENFYSMELYDDIYLYIKETLKLYLSGKDSIDVNGNLFSIGMDKLFFESTILDNEYNSFLQYNNIKYNIDIIIFSLGYMYIKKRLGYNVNFKDFRGLELLCYNYIQLIYEGKIR